MSGAQPGQGKSQVPAVKQQVPALSEDTIRKLIDQQSTEAALRSQELAIRRQELDHQSKHASDILGAQERDREAERVHTRKMGRDKLVFIVLIAVALLSFAIWGLLLNKDAVVKEILQIIISATLGAAGGFGAGRLSKKSDTPAD